MLLIYTQLFLCYMHRLIHTDTYSVTSILHTYIIDKHMFTPALHAHHRNTQAQTSMVPHIIL